MRRGAVHRQVIKKLPGLAPGDAKILLSDRNILVCFLVYRDKTEI